MHSSFNNSRSAATQSRSVAMLLRYRDPIICTAQLKPAGLAIVIMRRNQHVVAAYACLSSQLFSRTMASIPRVFTNMCQHLAAGCTTDILERQHLGPYSICCRRPAPCWRHLDSWNRSAQDYTSEGYPLEGCAAAEQDMDGERDGGGYRASECHGSPAHSGLLAFFAMAIV